MVDRVGASSLAAAGWINVFASRCSPPTSPPFALMRPPPPLRMPAIALAGAVAVFLPQVVLVV